MDPSTSMHLETVAPIVPQLLNASPVKEPTSDVHVTLSQLHGTVQSPPVSIMPQYFLIHNQQSLKVTGSNSNATSNAVVTRTLAPKPSPPVSTITPNTYRAHPSLSLKPHTIYPHPPLFQTFKPQVTSINSSTPAISSSTSVPSTPRTKTIVLQNPRVLGPLGGSTKHTVTYLSPTSILKPAPSIQTSVTNQSVVPTVGMKQHMSSLLLTRKLPLQVGGGGTGSINLKITNGIIQNEGQTSIKLLQEGVKSTSTPPPLVLQAPASTLGKKQPHQQPFIITPLRKHYPKKWAHVPIKPKKTVLQVAQPVTLNTVSRKPNIIKPKCPRLSSTSGTNSGKQSNTDNTRAKPAPSQVSSANSESSQSAGPVTTNTENHGRTSKQDLNRCLQEVVDSLFPRMSSGLAQKQDANEVTLMKIPMSAQKEEEKAAIVPDDDIHIELVPQKYDCDALRHDLACQKPTYDLHTAAVGQHAHKDESPCTSVTAQRPTGESLSSVVTAENSLTGDSTTCIGSQKTEDMSVKVDSDKCIEKVSSTSGTDETTKTDTKVVDWDGDLAAIPGIDLKFRLNEFGLMEMVDGNNLDKIANVDSKEEKLDMESSDNKKVDLNEGKTEKVECKEETGDDKSEQVKKPDEICCCGGCGCYGLQSEFFNSSFCSESCIEEARYRQEFQEKKFKEHEELSKKRRKIRIMQQQKKEEKKLKAQIQVQNLLDTLENVVSASVSHSETTDPLQSGPTSGTEEDVSNDGSQESGKPLMCWQKGKNRFLWAKYLEYYKVKPAPAKLFRDSLPFSKNGFKVGMKLEGIDPEHASLFCVLTVASVSGFRIKLHFDGYGDEYDFWVNANSADIFPAGWCEKNGRVLEPPPGYTRTTFQWSQYLKQCRLPAASKLLFSNRHATNVCILGFRIGNKLEAVDRQNTSLVCVATVADLLDNRILVHFDGWDDVYDYWADPTSSYIHPVGWCEENNHTLTPPNDFKDEKFVWDEYLKATKSTAAPSRAFKPRLGSFSPGMRLECVDRRNPAIIRVAAVDDVREHQIRVKFDGWTDIYSYWIDDDSQDIHPMTWCSKAAHPLEAPLTIDDQAADCPTPGCKGQGHVQGSKNMKNHTVTNCPYDPQNLILHVDIPDRLTTKPRQRPTLGEKRIADQKPRPGRPPKWSTIEARNRPGRPPKYRRLEEDKKEASGDDPLWTTIEDENREKRRQRKVQKQAAIAKRNFEYDQVRRELHQAVMNPGYDPNPTGKSDHLWAKHSVALNTYVNAAVNCNVASWSMEEVSSFMASIPGCHEKGNKFLENDIDGEALSMMSQHEFIVYMGLKVGPAVKLFNTLVLLKQKLDQT